MRKIIVAMVFVSLAFASCKKEEVATPASEAGKVMGGEKKDMGGWDVLPSTNADKVMGGEKKDMGGWDLLPEGN